MSFIVSGLPFARFEPLIGLPDDVLAEHGAVRVVSSDDGRYPCRVTLEDAAPGQTLLLVNYEHQAAATPYRSSYAIFVSEAARETRRMTPGELPSVLRGRNIALRAYDAGGMLLEAALCLDDDVAEAAERLLADPAAAYLHAHNAAAGCFAARIDRAQGLLRPVGLDPSTVNQCHPGDLRSGVVRNLLSPASEVDPG